MKLVVSFLGLAVISVFLWGTSWPFKASLALAAFFALVISLELLAARRHERADKGELASEDSVVGQAAKADHAFLPDGDWHKRVIVAGGRPISVRIGAAANLLAKALPYASALCSDPDVLLSRFRAFQSVEAARRPEVATEIRDLEIESIDFVSPHRPDSAEVSFTPASGGESWTCLLIDGDFRDLLPES